MTKLQELRNMDQVQQMKSLMNMTNKDMVAILKEEKVKGRTKYKNKNMLQDKVLEMLFVPAPEKVEILEGQVTVEEVIDPVVVEVESVEVEKIIEYESKETNDVYIEMKTLTEEEKRMKIRRERLKNITPYENTEEGKRKYRETISKSLNSGYFKVDILNEKKGEV